MMRSSLRGIFRIMTAFSAVASQVVLVVPFTVGSPLLAPMWAVTVFYLLAVAAVLTLLKLLRSGHLFLSPIVPFTHGLLFFLFMSAGDQFLGWTA
jgi:hypothetical protein